MAFNVSGKTIVITGAGSGIGRALAIGLSKKKANLALSDINDVSLAETRRQCEQYSNGLRIETDTLDVSDKDAFHSYADKTIKAFGSVDGVINNAGVAVASNIEDVSYEDFEWIMSINFWGMVYGTKAFLPHLKIRHEAFVINISSIFGIVSAAGYGTYNASKFAIRGFTEALRQELSDTNVSVISVHPGGINTNIVDTARLGNSHDDKDLAQFKGNLVHTPEKAANVIINAIEHSKSKVLVGYDAKALDLFQRLMPVSYDVVVKKLFLGQ